MCNIFESVKYIVNVVFYIPFALPHSPTGDDPQRTYHNEKDSAGINGHQCLEDESCVKCDVIEGPDRSRGCVCKKFTNKTTKLG